MPQPYEWATLRVVPRVERGEFVNVAVLVYSRPLQFLGLRVTDDLERARALHPGLDVAAVRRHLQRVAQLCDGDPGAGENAARSAGERFRWLVAPRSTVVQPSPVHTGLTDDPDGALADLYARMVA